MKARTYFEALGRQAQALGRSRNSPTSWTAPQRLWFGRGWRSNQSRQIQQALKAGPKYVIVPGYVRSTTDGQLHYVGVAHLAELYGVRPSDFCTLPELDHHRHSSIIAYTNMTARIERGELIELYPRRDGDYRLPTNNTEGGHVD